MTPHGKSAVKWTLVFVQDDGSPTALRAVNSVNSRESCVYQNIFENECNSQTPTQGWAHL